MELFGLPEDKVRVVQMETGGAFGGKEDYPSMIAGHAALLARKSGRPVKIIYDRMEDMAATTKRHPSRTRHRTAVMADGKILGGDIEFCHRWRGVRDAVVGGALARDDSLGWAILLAECARFAVKGGRDECHRRMGLFADLARRRALFAMERHMDRDRAGSGADHPRKFRRRNFLRAGQTTTTEQVFSERDRSGVPTGARARHAGLRREKKQLRTQNAERPRKKGDWHRHVSAWRGIYRIGRALSEFAGGRGRHAGGAVRVLVSSTEFGQGTNTVLCQVAAETLGIDYEAWRWRSQTPALCRTAGPPSLRGRRWWWGSWCIQRRWVRADFDRSGLLAENIRRRIPRCVRGAISRDMAR